MYTPEQIYEEFKRRGWDKEGNPLQQQAAQQQPIKNNIPTSEIQQDNQQQPENNLLMRTMPPLRLLGDALLGAAQGGQALHNAPYNIVNYFSPETAKKMISSGIGRLLAPERTDFSTGLGINNPNIVDKLIQGTVSATPEYLAGGGAVRGGALAGAVLNQDDPLLGSIVGAGTGALAKAIPAGINAFRYRPSKVANTIKDMISEEAIAANAAPSKGLYNQVFENTKGQNIYGNKINKGKISLESLTAKIPENKISEAGIKYTNLNPNRVQEVYRGSKLKLLHNDFIKNPTIENAHHLQSQLGTEIRKLKAKDLATNALDIADRKTLDSYLMARGILKNDINNFLDKNVQGLGDVYGKASLLHAKDVVPLKNAEALASAHLLPGEELDINTLSRALRNMTTKKSLQKMPLPEKLITLSEKLRKGVKTTKVLKKYGFPVALGAPYLGHQAKKYLTGVTHQ